MILESTFKKLQKVYDREYGTGKPSIMVEEFMSGDMYSLDMYITHNNEYFFLPPVRVITAAEIGLDGYYSYRHILPTNLSQDEIKNANNCAKKAVIALGLNCSTAHVELYKTPSGWKIIEVGPRIGGYRQELYYEAFGIDHYLNDLFIHFGKTPNIKKLYSRYAAGLNIHADTEGIIHDVSGVDSARTLPSVTFLNCYVKPGDKAIFASNGGQFLVDGILSNNLQDKLEHDVSKVRELISFDIK